MADLTALLKPGSDDDWETPQWLFDLLDEEFGFVADLAATPGNAKHERYLSPATDAFQQDWRRFLHAGAVPTNALARPRAGAVFGVAQPTLRAGCEPLGVQGCTDGGSSDPGGVPTPRQDRHHVVA